MEFPGFGPLRANAPSPEPRDQRVSGPAPARNPPARFYANINRQPFESDSEPDSPRESEPEFSRNSAHWAYRQRLEPPQTSQGSMTFYDRDWKEIPQSDILGNNRCKGGIVARRGDIAIKMPLRSSNSLSDVDTRDTIRRILHEQDIYRALGNKQRGIIPFIDMPHDEIHLPYMKNGTLADFLKKKHPSTMQQANWFLKIAIGLELIHKTRVIPGSWNASNILFDDNWKPVFFNFDEARICAGDGPLEEMQYGGTFGEPNVRTVKTDIRALGELFYYISLGHLRAMTDDPVRDILGSDDCSERVRDHFTGHGNLTGLEKALEDITNGCMEGRYSLVEEIVDILSPLTGFELQ